MDVAVDQADLEVGDSVLDGLVYWVIEIYVTSTAYHKEVKRLDGPIPKMACLCASYPYVPRDCLVFYFSRYLTLGTLPYR